MPKTVITVDPGISGTGVAVWHGDAGDKPPVFTCVLRSPSSMTWIARVRMVSSLFDAIAAEFKPAVAYIEFPKFYDDASGHKVAKTGSLFELTTLIGAFTKTLWVHECRVEMIEARWKGQLPKKAVAARAKRLLGASNLTKVKSHAWDAVGLGLYVKGVFGK